MKFQGHSRTSYLAAVSIAPSAGTLRAEVYSCLMRAGLSGMTDEELCDALRMGGSTERPRRVELVDGGWVVDSRARRFVRSGRLAVVWRAVGIREEDAT